MTTSARLSHLVPKQSFIFHRLHRGKTLSLNLLPLNLPDAPIRLHRPDPPLNAFREVLGVLF